MSLIEKAALLLEERLTKKKQFLDIMGREENADVYMRRYFLFRSKYLSVYMHRFLRSDTDDPHDHPFSFLGYVIKGSYREERWIPSEYKKGFLFKSSMRRSGTWAFRNATDVHMVKLDKEYSLDELKQGPLTVIFRGPCTREWGFWKDSATESPLWVYWREYLGVPEAVSCENPTGHQAAD